MKKDYTYLEGDKHFCWNGELKYYFENRFNNFGFASFLFHIVDYWKTDEVEFYIEKHLEKFKILTEANKLEIETYRNRVGNKEELNGILEKLGFDFNFDYSILQKEKERQEFLKEQEEFRQNGLEVYNRLQSKKDFYLERGFIEIFNEKEKKLKEQYNNLLKYYKLENEIQLL